MIRFLILLGVLSLLGGCPLQGDSLEGGQTSLKESDERWDVLITSDLGIGKNFTPQVASPSYSLLIKRNFMEAGRKPIRVYKNYTNGTLEELSFPSDTFENVGKDFHQRKLYKKENMLTNHTPRVKAWNGSTWLMDNGYSLITYDGKKFNVHRYVESVYSPLRPQRLIPLGKYWIITYVDTGTPNNRVWVFDGREIIKKVTFNRNSNTTVKIRRNMSDITVKVVLERKKEITLHDMGGCDQCHEAPTMEEMKEGLHKKALEEEPKIHRELCERCHDVYGFCKECHSLPEMLGKGAKRV